MRPMLSLEGGGVRTFPTREIFQQEVFGDLQMT